MKISSKTFYGCIVLVLSTILPSCGEQFIRDKETYFVENNNRKWLVDTTSYKTIILTDSINNTERFDFDIQWKAFNSSKSKEGIFGIKGTEYRLYETIHQEFLSLKDENFNIVLTASELPEGTILKVNFYDIYYSYDLLKKELTFISTSLGRRPQIELIDEEYINHPINSEIIKHETILINGKTYSDALEFILKDFEDDWNESTITRIIIAKDYGLVQFSLNSGQVYNRIQ